MNKKAINPIVTIDNYGKFSRIKILGIDISKAVTKLEYDSHAVLVQGEKEELSGNIVLEVHLDHLTTILTDELNTNLDDIKEILEAYRKKE